MHVDVLFGAVSTAPLLRGATTGGFLLPAGGHSKGLVPKRDTLMSSPAIQVGSETTRRGQCELLRRLMSP
jgi:hypothetical protein